MEINKITKTLTAKIDRWNFEADYITENSINVFIYSHFAWGNKFIGYYDPKNKTIRPLYYNDNIDYRNGWQPTERQKEKIVKLCNKLLKSI